jgi:hypothetical protein
VDPGRGTLCGVATDKELLELVEQGRFEDLHGSVTIVQIAAAWLAEGSAGGGEYGWASAVWYDEPDEPRRRSLLAALIEQADDGQLSLVAAGPLESFVSDDESGLAWIERQAAQSARFRQALTMSQVSGLPDRAFARLERAAQAQLRLSPEQRDRFERRRRPPS